jgi:hypothetical protein
MTSIDVAQATLRRLAAFGGDADASAGSAFRFARDFDSTLTFPDLPYDPAAPSSRYADATRGAIDAVVDAAGSTIAARAPNAFALVNEALDRVMLRTTIAIDHASSSSNRVRVGICVLTNVHVPADRVFVCIEALVHEATHQYLYRLEQDRGLFCDLDARQRFRSPWSGNRIPLHSLVHACFVYFGLLGLWTRLAATAEDDAQAAWTRDRLASIVFGFGYVRELLATRIFPRDRVEPAILQLIERIARSLEAAGLQVSAHDSVAAALRLDAGRPWIDRLAACLRALDGHETMRGGDSTAVLMTAR